MKSSRCNLTFLPRCSHERKHRGVHSSVRYLCTSASLAQPPSPSLSLTKGDADETCLLQKTSNSPNIIPNCRKGTLQLVVPLLMQTLQDEVKRFSECCVWIRFRVRLRACIK